jgi:hypothetical protein
MLLCDAAEESGGKLYILGGGWSMLRAPNIPVNMALAVKLSIPWDQTNRPVKVRCGLIDADGEAIKVEDNEVFLEGEIEVGRPPGTKPGQSLDAPMVFNFQSLALPAGGYVWQLEIDGKEAARTPFRVLGQ